MKGLKGALKEAWFITKETFLHPLSTTYYDDNLNVIKRVDDKGNTKYPKGKKPAASNPPPG